MRNTIFFTLIVLAVATTGCGGTDAAPPLVDGSTAAGGTGEPVTIGNVVDEDFNAVDAVIVPPGAQSECFYSNGWLILSGEPLICSNGDAQVGEPRLEIMMPFKAGRYASPADGECILTGESKYYAFVEGKESGTHDATEGFITIDEIGAETVRGEFNFTRFDGDQGDVLLSARYLARRCGI